MITSHTLEDSKVNIKLKLACLWASFMFLYIYVDHFALYMPHAIENLLKSRVFEFDITPSFIFIALFLATIPMLMICLSVVLPAKANRWTNIIVAILMIPYMLFNLAGEAWAHMYFAAAIEILLLGLIIKYAYNWPSTG